MQRSHRKEKLETAWERDRAIYRELAADAPADAIRERADLVRSWLEARRFLDRGTYFGGADLVRSWKLLVSGTAVASFVVGLGHAGGVLLLLDQNGHVSATKAALATVGVQGSRLRRDDPGQLVSTQTSQAWATFLTLSILTYGVLLRLVLFQVMALRTRAAARTPVLEEPPVEDLLRRMMNDAPKTPMPGHPVDPLPRPRRRWWKTLVDRIA